MRDKNLLNQREEDIMYLLWDEGKALTTADISQTFNGKGWNKSTMFNTIQSLLEKEYIRISGMERNKTQYARRFEAAITKDEYAARLLAVKGITKSTIGNVILAMTGGESDSHSDSMENEQLIKDLEAIIEYLREGEKDK